MSRILTGKRSKHEMFFRRTPQSPFILALFFTLRRELNTKVASIQVPFRSWRISTNLFIFT